MRKGNRILILVPSSKTPGGVGNYFKIIKPQLKSAITFFTRGVRNQQSLLSRMVFPIVMFYDIFRFFFFLLIGNYSLVQINTSFGITGIFRDSIFIFIARLFNVKFLVFFRGIDEGVIKQVEKRYWWLFRNTFLKAVCILVLSEKMKQTVINWGYNKPVVIETTIVDTNLLKKFDINKIEEKFHVNKPVEILFLSRLEREKGIYEAINAFRIISRKKPNTILRICGDGSETKKVLEYIGSDLNKNIFYEGFVTGERKAYFFSQAHIYLFPSYAEGMPNSLLEAISFGLPVITSNVGGISDFFKEPYMGYMTESIQPHVLSGYIERLIENPEYCRNISRFNYIFARDHFYAEVVASRIDTYYSTILDG